MFACVLGESVSLFLITYILYVYIEPVLVALNYMHRVCCFLAFI
jgi:hypothetical protein